MGKRNELFFFCLCWRDRIDAMNILYVITEETYSSEASIRISYGIAVYAVGKDGSTTAMIDAIHDITSHKKALIELVALCNRLELSVLHLHEVVDDFLAS